MCNALNLLRTQVASSHSGSSATIPDSGFFGKTPEVQSNLNDLQSRLTPPQPSPSGGKALAGFLLSGFLLALLGAILPAWGYHRDPPDFIAVGNYFLSLAVGIVAASRLARRIMARRGSRSCWFSPAPSPACPLATWRWSRRRRRTGGAWPDCWPWAPAPACSTWRCFTPFPGYQADAAGTVNKGGIWYGLGCLAATLLVLGTFYAYTVPSILVFMALVPAIFGGIYVRSRISLPPPEGAQPTLRQALQDFRSPGAVLFALLLFFQFGNEWSIAGWLPLFLIRRVGLSPTAALSILALYWLFLMAGRLVAVAILPRVRHGRLLMGSGAAAMFGCLILFFTNNCVRRRPRASSSSARASPASIRWWPRPSAAASPITIPDSSTASSPWRWWAACWRRPRWGTQPRYGGRAWSWGFRCWVRSW